MDPMRLGRYGPDAVEVDTVLRTVRVEGGCPWRDVHAATLPRGLVVPSGISGQADVADFSIGGGVGVLARKFGLAIDNLLDAEVVRADGRSLRLDDAGHPGLLRALGRGGDLCTATRLTFRLHPVGRITGGPAFWPLSHAPMVMRWFRDFIATAPAELGGFVIMTTLPMHGPCVPALRGLKVCGIVWCHVGTPTQADRDLAPMHRLGLPLVLGLQTMPFGALQCASDASRAGDLRWRRRVVHTRRLDDASIETHMRFAAALPTPRSAIHLFPLDAAATSRSHDCRIDRDAHWAEVAVAASEDPADEVRVLRWCKDWWDALHSPAAADRCLDAVTDGQLSPSEA